MPTVQNILDDIKTLVPHSFTNDQVINWMNEGMRKLYKYMSQNEIYEFQTVKNQPTYRLPSNCTIDQIVSLELSQVPVTVDSSYESYSYAGLNQEMAGSNYYDACGLIGLYPIPDEVCNVKIFFNKRPFLLTSDKVDVIPEVNEDYQDAIKYYACSIIASAGRAPNISLANMYIIKFNDIVDWLFKDLAEKKAKTPTKSRANKWW